MGYVVPVTESGSVRRDWTLWFQPRALEGRVEGLIFAGLCVLSLALIAGADVVSGRGVSVGSFQVIPVIAAGWLLSDRLLAAVSVAAILARFLVVLLGGDDVVTASVQAGVVPFMAIVSRTAAVSVVAAHAAAARDRLVSRIARIVSSADSLDEILQQVVWEMAREDMRGGTIALIDERNRLYIVAAEGEISDDVRQFRLPVGEGIMGRAAAEGRPLLVNDLDAPDAPGSPTRSLSTNSQIRSIVVVPLLAAGRVLGVLELDSSRPHQFGEPDVLLLEQVAVAVAGAVQRQGALRLADENLQGRLRELAILLDAARGLASSLELDVLGTAICLSATEITLGSVTSSRRSNVLRIKGAEGEVQGEYDEAGETTLGVAFTVADSPALLEMVTTGVPTTATPESMQGALRRDMLKTGTHAAAYAPIRVGNSLWGALSVATREEHQFAPSELRLLQGMADLAGLAIGNAESMRVEKLRSEQLQEHGERMAALDHAKSEFLRLASHELRGPLAVLRGYTSMLADGSLGAMPEGTGRILDVMTGKVGEINLLIDQMLETARLEDSRLQLALEATDLRGLVRTAGSTLKLLAGPQHPLRVQVPSQAVPVMIDGPRVMTILTNLIDNAIKYSPGGGEVRVRLAVGADVARIEVTDKGLGIDPGDLPRLFTRFGRLVTSENSHIPGTGLGLYLARELARMHGGDITVSSAVGRGSTFTLELPLTEARAAASA
jgi:signal transduction histidine kinase